MSEDAVAEETAETAQDAGTPVEDALDEPAGSGDETAEATVQEADLAVAEGEDAPTKSWLANLPAEMLPTQLVGLAKLDFGRLSGLMRRGRGRRRCLRAGRVGVSSPPPRGGT